VAGQRGGSIGAGYHVPRIDVSTSELLVHVTGRLLVGKTVISAGADTFQADWLWWEENCAVEEGHSGGGAESLQEPRADHPIVDDRIPACGQSPCCRPGGFRNDLVLAVRRRGPRRDVALIDESEELVPGDQSAGVEEMRKGLRHCRLAGSWRAAYDDEIGHLTHDALVSADQAQSATGTGTVSR
jgi:hypothetical protein